MSEENLEVEARRDGWVPKEEFRGSEDQWVTAEEFVERGKQINPILRANNDRLKKELAARDKKISDIETSVEEFKKFQREAHEKKVQGLEKELRSLRAARSEATSQEDHEKAAEIEEQIDSVKDKITEAKVAPEKKETPPPAAKIEPELQEWLDSNPWYGDVDNYMEESDMVSGLGAALRKKYPNLTGKSFLNKLDEVIEEKLPYLKQPAKKGPSPEGTSRTARPASRSSGKHSFENLPQDAKDACTRFIADGVIKNKEEYLKDYEWED